jgi:hypothetical protein
MSTDQVHAKGRAGAKPESSCHFIGSRRTEANYRSNRHCASFTFDAHPFFSFSSINTATHSSTSRPSVRPTALPFPPLHKPHAATFSQPSSITSSIAEYQPSTPTVPLHWSILSQRQSNCRLTSLKAESLVEMKLPIGLGD